MPQNDVTSSYPVAFVGMEPDNSFVGDNYINRVSDETTKQIAFGMVVMEDSAHYGSGCLQFTSQTGIPLGMVPYANAYQINHELANVADSDGNLGMVGGTNLTIKRRGRLWVKIDEDVTPASAVRARTSVVSTVGPGTFRASALATHTVDFSAFARWCGSYTAATGYALLEFDFTAAGKLMVADS
jgi:hypothetical protein